MRKHPLNHSRQGALILESALVYPVLMFLLVGFVICGMAVFRYQQVTCQAREVARWASVRGADYEGDTNSSSPSQQDMLQTVLLPLAVGMATENLSLQVQWIDQATGTVYDWDSSPKDVKSVTDQGEYITNTVRVTVTYRLPANLFWQNPLQVTSTSEIPMAY